MARGDRIRHFWSRLSLRELAPFLGAVFCTFTVFGFMRDVQSLGRLPPVYVTYIAVSSGLVAVGYVLAMRAGPRLWLPVVVVTQIGAEALGRPWLGREGPPLGDGELLSRLNVDTSLTIVALFVGYLGFVSFIANQGLRRLRLDTEIALAREIHEALVPQLSLQEGGFDVAGASYPASEVGGDLVDAVPVSGRLTCYVADVSGHGVPAGTLMAAVKSAARMRLLRSGSGADLLTDLNRVLFAIKRSNMFATAAVLSIDAARVHYALAGHLPILHWRKADRQIARHAEGHLVLGIFEDVRYDEHAIDVAPGDVLAIVTDGLTEVVDGRENELGLAGIEAVLAARAEAPLADLAAALLARVRAYGPQRDDQTLLVMRRLP
jgi:Stage II sporulation protein E (SpoIIE)